MKLLILLESLLLMVFSCSREQYHQVPRMLVYNIAQHNDSIYFSTSDNGIFSFPATAPGAMKRLATAGHLPIRSIAFASNGTLYAGSYYSGVHYFKNDTLLPLSWARQLSW